MKKKFLSLFLLVGMALCILAGCGTNNDASSSAKPQAVDYASELTLDMTTNTKKTEATVLYYIDGDTTHFNVSDPSLDTTILKARYLGVNTPESTGKIEEWGKKASNFTKEKLESATSIILETDGTKWETDSTGERYLVWVWYKPEGENRYYNLNIQILQEGLAVGSSAGNTRYGSLCTKVINQAKTLGLHVHGKDKDPDFYYGAAFQIDLKELRTNIESYNGKKVAFDATVAFYNNQGVYLEDYDEETQMYYGIYAYYGYFLEADGIALLAVGNRVHLSGNVQYYEVGGTYQLSDLSYNSYRPTADDIRVIDTEKHPAAYAETTVDMLTGKVTIEKEDDETGEVTSTQVDYAALALNTTVTMRNLTVKDMYTTDKEDSSSNGAITLYCEDENGKEVQLRTTVLYDSDNNLITEAYFQGKTIASVKGVIDYFSGDYQIKVFHVAHFTFAE